jgi:hypothetical protein
MHTGFGWGDLRVRNHLEDLGRDGNVLKEIFKKWVGGGHGLAQDTDRCRALVNAVTNIRFP